MPDPRIWPITNVTDFGIGVPNASTLVLAAHLHRQDADFTNDGEYVIYLARGNAAVVGSGIRLNPYGGSYHIGLYNLFLGAIYGISDNDMQEESNLAISEGHE